VNRRVPGLALARPPSTLALMRAACLFRALLPLLAWLSCGYKEVAPPPRVVLPTPLTAAASLAAIQVPADLEVELVAAEPAVLDPVDLAWGADGRLWVVEMADYPRGLDGKGQPGGRIRVLESTRGDGRYDRSTLFADGLRSPTAVLPWRAGVLVVAVPDLLFLEDTDGDGRADVRRPLFTGLAEGNEQHLSNGLQWGLDGWVHLANGNSGGKVRRAGAPGPVVELGQRDFRLRPDSGEIETVAGQTQAGRNRDDWGNWFGGNNSNPIWHYALEEHYLRRNPRLVPPSATVTVAAIPGAARVYPRSQTLARFNDGFAANHFTSACGTVIYRDTLLGPAYAGNVFVCEPVHNLVHREVLEADGASFRSRRPESEANSEFLASTDAWSRFVAARAGPDGALYVADMYRLVIEHPQWIPDAWQRVLGDLRAGSGQGRIYRIRPRGGALRAVPRLDRADAAGLAAALRSSSGALRDLAQQQLEWRRAEGAAVAVEQVAEGAELPAARAQALWTLQGIGALKPGALLRALRDPHAGVRRQAVRLAEPLGAGEPELRAAVIRLVDDPDAAVRQQVGYSLGEWRGAEAGEALARLLARERDRYARAAALSSALPHAEAVLESLQAAGPAQSALVAEIAAATGNARALTRLLAAVPAALERGELGEGLRALGELLDLLQRQGQTLARLHADAGAPLRQSLEALDSVLARARVVAADPASPTGTRLSAVALLGRGRSQQAEDGQLLASLLDARQPPELQVAAARALGGINRTQTPGLLLAGWDGHAPRLRGVILGLLAARPAWAQVLLDRAERDEAFRAQIDAARRTVLTQHANPRIAERAAAVFGATDAAGRQAVVRDYLQAVASLRADPRRGGDVFAQSCSACHRFGPVPGRAVGPDLAGVKDRSPEYLIGHILDPNRAVEDRYLFYTANLADGRTAVGMLAAESAGSLTLMGLDGEEQVILRSELRSLISSGRSLMPEGLEAALDAQAMTDLVGFLASRETSGKR
jgi:putative membrane-bound dehydrogenase-like protein